MQLLLSSPPTDEERGNLPIIPPGAYVAFCEGSSRRLVFLFDPATLQAYLYNSCDGWDRAYVMKDGALPGDIILDNSEAAWAMACWKAVQAQTKAGHC